MTAPSRSNQFSKLHKVLKKHYKPYSGDSERGVLEQLLFACCAENAHYDVAEQAYAALVHNFFDLNEIRVSSIRELAEVMNVLPDPPAAAHRAKRVLQSVFEATYDFTLEELRKQNLGPATERLAKFTGTTSFTVAYVVQNSLGGHAIPIDAGTMRALLTLQLVSDEDAKAGNVPGLERAIAKSKGVEFATLLHQLGADFAANPYSPALKAILTEVDPEAAGRMPKRRAGREGETPVQRRRRRAAAKRARLAKGAKSEEEAEGGKKSKGGKKRSERASQASKKKQAAPESKPAAPKKKAASSAKKSSAKKKTEPKAASGTPAEKKRTESAGISKRKPR